MRSPTRYSVRCPRCHTRITLTMQALDQRESALEQRAQELDARQASLRLREEEHEAAIRLIRSCLHPDRHPTDAKRYNRAFQAFSKMLVPDAAPATPFNDDIPF